MPAPVKKTVNVASNFLCDNSGYLLGVDGKGKPARTAECFAAAKQLHLELLQGIPSPPPRPSSGILRPGTRQPPPPTPLFRRTGKN